MKTKRRVNLAARVSNLILPAAPAAAAAAAVPAVSLSDLVTRANTYLDLESQIAGFIAAQPQQRAAEQAKLVSDLLTATNRTPTSVTTRVDTYNAAVKVIEQQTADLKELLPVLERATNEFAKANIDAIKLALEQRRGALELARSKDKQDSAALAHQIKIIEERLHHFESIAAKA